jgi:hypothetical protein
VSALFGYEATEAPQTIFVTAVEDIPQVSIIKEATDMYNDPLGKSK